MTGALQVTAAIVVVAAIVGGVWLLMTDSTEARTTDEKMRAAEKQHYDEMLQEWRE